MTRPASLLPTTRGRRPVRRRPVVDLALLVIAAATIVPIGATHAVFSDVVVVPDNRAGAGTLLVVGDDDVRVDLPDRGTVDTGRVTVTNAGGLDAEVALTIVPTDATSDLCADHDPAGHAGDLTVTIASEAASDLCGATHPTVALGTLAPDATRPIDLEVALAADAHLWWSGRTTTYELRITGAQPGGGFSDLTVGTLTVTVGTYAPQPRPRAAPQASRTTDLTPGDPSSTDDPAEDAVADPDPDLDPDPEPDPTLAPSGPPG